MDETKVEELFREAEIAELNYQRLQLQNTNVDFKEKIKQDIAYEYAYNKAVAARKKLCEELDKMYKN